MEYFCSVLLKVTGAKFRFKRTPTTPAPSSHVQLSTSTQQSTVSSTLSVQQSVSADIGVMSGDRCHSRTTSFVTPSMSAVSQVAGTAVDDMWVAGELELKFLLLYHIRIFRYSVCG